MIWDWGGISLMRKDDGLLFAFRLLVFLSHSIQIRNASRGIIFVALLWDTLSGHLEIRLREL